MSDDRYYHDPMRSYGQQGQYQSYERQGGYYEQRNDTSYGMNNDQFRYGRGTTTGGEYYDNSRGYEDRGPYYARGVNDTVYRTGHDGYYGGDAYYRDMNGGFDERKTGYDDAYYRDMNGGFDERRTGYDDAYYGDRNAPFDRHPIGGYGSYYEERSDSVSSDSSSDIGYAKKARARGEREKPKKKKKKVKSEEPEGVRVVKPHKPKKVKVEPEKAKKIPEKFEIKAPPNFTGVVQGIMEKMDIQTTVSTDDDSLFLDYPEPIDNGAKIREQQDRLLQEKMNKQPDIKQAENVKNKTMSEYRKKKMQYMRIQYGLDIVFIMDCTDSMGPWIEQARHTLSEIATEFQEQYRQSVLRFAFVAYRDIPQKLTDPERVEVHPFTENVVELTEFIAGLEADGGRDIPENVAIGFEEALALDWQANTKLIIHIADAPCHGTQYHDLHHPVPEVEDDYAQNIDITKLGLIDDYPTGDPDRNIAELVKEMATKKIDYYFGRITLANGECYTDKMTEKFDRLYKRTNKQSNFDILPLDTDPKNFVPQVMRSMSQSAPRPPNEDFEPYY